MSFEFVEQAPADTLRLFDFVKTNRNNIELEEEVKKLEEQSKKKDEENDSR